MCEGGGYSLVSLSLKPLKKLIITLQIGILVENSSEILIRNFTLSNGIRIHIVFRSIQSHAIWVAPLFAANMGPDVFPYHLFDVRWYV